MLAIDGPAGAGKSTVARRLAERYRLSYIDSGAMYRCVALMTRRRGLNPEDKDAVGRLAAGLDIAFQTRDDRPIVLLNGEDVTAAIRAAEVGDLASIVSQSPGVREAMVLIQRRYGAEQAIVMEGRDIGTVVFPGADVKVFLTASLEERARRRADELSQVGGRPVDAAAVRDSVGARDVRDTTRSLAPLARAEDAVEVITDGRSVDEVVSRIGDLLPAWIRNRASLD